MFLVFTIIFILIGSTSVLVYATIYKGIDDTFPLIVTLWSLVGLLFTILEWRDYRKNEKKPNKKVY